MPVDITVTGTEKLVRLAAAIKASGDKNLQRELTQGMRRAARPYPRAARQGALQILPHHGGLDERVAASRFSVRVRTSGSGAGLTVTGASGDNIRRMDEQGIVRHPVYGDRKKWVSERITRGWFTKPMILESRDTYGEVVKAVDDVAAQLEAEGG